MLSREQVKKLDRLLSRAILARDPKCRLSGADSTEPHHIFKRGRHIRWRVENSIGVNRWAHTETPEMIQQAKDIMIADYGQELHDEFEFLSKQACVRVDFEEIKEYLESELKKLGG